MTVAGSTFRLGWSPALVERLRAGMPLTVLGRSSLPDPLGGMVVLGRTGSGAAALAAAIMPGGTAGWLSFTPFGLGHLAAPMRPPPALQEEFPTRAERKAVFILDAEGHDQLVALPGLFNQLVIACGAWPLLVPLLAPRTRPLGIADEESLQRGLDTFCAAVATAVNAYYEGGDTQGAIELELEPTGINAEAALRWLRQVGRGARGAAATAARLATRTRPPGRVAEEGVIEQLSFSDVGGQEEAKAELEAICLALREPEVYQQWAVRPPRGVLLYGPPGTGKTLLARVLAREAGATFIHIRAADITSKWYGEAESRMQHAFDWARKQSPAVIFFDEIDAIARSRDDAHEATHRLVSTLLENMDGLQEMKGVLVLAATNRPEAVDAALTRPGRFDRLVEVPLPTREGRRAIFEVHLGRAERQAARRLFAPFDEAEWERLLNATEGFSGADVAEVVRRGLEAKARTGVTEGEITAQDLLAEASGVARPW